MKQNPKFSLTDESTHAHTHTHTHVCIHGDVFAPSARRIPRFSASLIHPFVPSLRHAVLKNRKNDARFICPAIWPWFSFSNKAAGYKVSLPVFPFLLLLLLLFLPKKKEGERERKDNKTWWRKGRGKEEEGKQVKEILFAARIVTRIETGANSSIRGHFRKRDTLAMEREKNSKVFSRFYKNNFSPFFFFLFGEIFFFSFDGSISWLMERFV